jgi:flagellar protein FliO/FliZ
MLKLRKRMGIILMTIFFLLLVQPPYRVHAVEGSVEDAIKTHETQGIQEQQKENATGRNGQGPSFLWSFIQLIIVMIVLIGVIYLLIRFLSSRKGHMQALGMRTIGIHPLTSNRSIHVVAMEDRILILGVGDDVTLLQVVDQPEKVEQWKRLIPEKDTQWAFRKVYHGQPFDAFLRKKLEEMKRQRQNLERWDEENR